MYSKVLSGQPRFKFTLLWNFSRRSLLKSIKLEIQFRLTCLLRTKIRTRYFLDHFVNSLIIYRKILPMPFKKRFFPGITLIFDLSQFPRCTNHSRNLSKFSSFFSLNLIMNKKSVVTGNCGKPNAPFNKSVTNLQCIAEI